jgi:hypothetical protein
MAESDPSPQPCTDIEREQDRVDGNDSAPDVIGSIVEQGAQYWLYGRHLFSEIMPTAFCNAIPSRCGMLSKPLYLPKTVT